MTLVYGTDSDLLRAAAASDTAVAGVVVAGVLVQASSDLGFTTPGYPWSDAGP